MSCKWATNLQKLHLMVWRHHWTQWGRQKHRFWESKIIASSCNFADWLKTASSTTNIPVFEKNYFVAIYFEKITCFLQVIFWYFEVKNQNIKNPRSPFCRHCFLCIIYLLFAFALTTLFLVNWQTFTFIRPKIGWNDVTKFDLKQKISVRFWFYLQETTNWCPERYDKFHVDTVRDEEVVKKTRGRVGSDPQAVARLTLFLASFKRLDFVRIFLDLFTFYFYIFFYFYLFNYYDFLDF